MEEMKKALLEKVPEAVFTTDESGKTGCVWTAQVPLSSIREVAKAFDSAGFFLETITGLDFEDTRELVYHFNRFEAASRAAVRILCAEGESPGTVSDIFRGAGWLEREVHDFFGITFAGNQDMRPFLLPEDADYHPLKKDFGKVGAYRKREEIYG